MCTASERGRAQCWCKTRDGRAYFGLCLPALKLRNCLCITLPRLRVSRPVDRRAVTARW